MDYSSESLWRSISVLQQDFHLFPFTARESIAFSDLSRVNNLPEIKTAAKLTNIDEYIESLPLKYETPLAKDLEKGVEPSGGQKQRIGLARALFHTSAIMILDEPTSNVDPKPKKRFLKILSASLAIKYLFWFPIVSVLSVGPIELLSWIKAPLLNRVRTLNY